MRVHVLLKESAWNGHFKNGYFDNFKCNPWQKFMKMATFSSHRYICDIIRGDWSVKLCVMPITCGISVPLWVIKTVFPGMDSYHKEEVVVRLSYFYSENPHTWKDGLYVKSGPCILWPPQHACWETDWRACVLCTLRVSHFVYFQLSYSVGSQRNKVNNRLKSTTKVNSLNPTHQLVRFCINIGIPHRRVLHWKTCVVMITILPSLIAPWVAMTITSDTTMAVTTNLAVTTKMAVTTN